MTDDTRDAVLLDEIAPDPAPDPPLDGATDKIDWPLVHLCAGEPETDIGNGRRLLHRHGEKLLFVSRVGPHVWDGRRWAEDEDDALLRPLAHDTAEMIVLEATFVPVPPDLADVAASVDEATMHEYHDLKQKHHSKREIDDRLRLAELERVVAKAEKAQAEIDDLASRRLRHAKSSAGSGRLDAMVAEAKPYRAARVDDLNQDPLALNVENGTLRFVRTPDPDCPDPDGERLIWEVRLNAPRRDDKITKMARATWVPDAEAPVFEAFLQRVVPDVEVRGFLKRYFGYALTGRTDEQVLVFLYGIGRNGKSTLVDTLARIMDDYAVSLSIDSLSGENRRGGAEATPDLARLPGARFVRASEPDMGVRLREGLVKQLTSGEPIPVRRLQQDFIEVYPTFKLCLSGNHRPTITGDDDGFWRRLLLVPFTIQIPEDEVDTHLDNKLWAERDGILTWMMEGALDWLREGLRPPEAVRAATREYREEQDPIGAFIRSACEVYGDNSVDETPAALFAAYERFCEAEGVFKLGQSTFTRRLSKATERQWADPGGEMRSFAKTKTGGVSLYRGIQIKAEFRGLSAPDPS